MNPFERFFYAEHGACRSYLFSKLFPLLLALDTWILMIGHAGRYGVADFNVAHFAWLDALLPTPTAGFYIAVLVLTGLLSFVVVLTGVRRGSVLLLFLLYTLSWSMSMLDSYQHHYLLSLILLCLAFFPQVRADQLHPQPAAAPAAAQRKPHAPALPPLHEEAHGGLYAGVVAATCAAYAWADSGNHVWVAFFTFAGVIGIATLMYTPSRPPPLLRSGFGFNLLGASVCIVYTYTAIAKMDANWVAGDTLRAISSVEHEFAPLAALAAHFGIEHERFYSLFATFVIPQELFMGVTYLVAVHQDRLRSRVVRAMCAIGCVLAIALHVGAEAMGLEIGWFSAYMLLLACCYLLPLWVVDRLCTVVTWPARLLARTAGDLESERRPAVGPSLALAGMSGLLLLLLGKLLDLPGALPACAIAAVSLVGVTLAQLWRARDPRAYAIAVAVAAAGMWVAIAASPVRWDFYRYLGGDMMRRGELAAALDAYEHGEHYAPPGKSRAAKIEQLRRRLGR